MSIKKYYNIIYFWHRNNITWYARPRGIVQGCGNVDSWYNKDAKNKTKNKTNYEPKYNLKEALGTMLTMDADDNQLDVGFTHGDAEDCVARLEVVVLT